LVLAQVSDPFPVAEVCKRFYEISCRIKAFKMKIDTRSMLEDLDTYESAVNSSRKVESIMIYSENRGRKRKFHSEEMKKLLENFREHVQELKIQHHFLRYEGFQLINSMTQVQKLKLHIIDVGKMNVPPSFRLRGLSNLRELEIYYCDEKILEIFGRLDDDILQKLTLNYLTGSSQSKYFGNQRSIVDLTTKNSEDLELLDWQRLKLKKVDVTLQDSTLNKFEGQDEIVEMKLSYYYLYHDDHPALSLNLARFKTLKVLEVNGIESETNVSLSSVEQLPNLKKLKVNRLAPFKSVSLQELSFYLAPSEDLLAETGVNCPNLRILETEVIDIGLILQHFPRIESLKCIDKVCSGDSIHQNLKHLRLDYDSTHVLSIVNRCEVLESLSVCFLSNQTILKNLLLSKPGLKSLILIQISPILLETIKEFGGNLEVFQCTLAHREPNLEMVKKELKDVFDVFYEHRWIYTAKKSGAVVNFKLD
jgi:hypothetical protein